MPEMTLSQLWWRMPAWVGGLLIGALTLGGALVFVGLIVSSADRSVGPAPKPAYANGQMVRFKMGGNVTGMVVERWCHKGERFCYYSIRTPSLSLTTQTRLFGPDDNVTIGPVTLLRGIMEFEIEPF